MEVNSGELLSPPPARQNTNRQTHNERNVVLYIKQDVINLFSKELFNLLVLYYFMYIHICSFRLFMLLKSHYVIKK